MNALKWSCCVAVCFSPLFWAVLVEADATCNQQQVMQGYCGNPNFCSGRNLIECPQTHADYYIDVRGIACIYSGISTDNCVKSTRPEEGVTCTCKHHCVWDQDLGMCKKGDPVLDSNQNPVYLKQLPYLYKLCVPAGS